MPDQEFTDLPIIAALEEDVDYFPFRDNSTGLDSRISPENMVKVFSQVGQLPFPAGAIPSADPNTLDDYEEGTWTPVLTFSTPGDLNVVYGTQVGQYTKIGRSITLTFVIITTTFTHTTAAANLIVTGCPFTSIAGGGNYVGAMRWTGITKANFTDMISVINDSSNIIYFVISGSAQTAILIAFGDVPTGTVKQLTSTITFFGA